MEINESQVSLTRGRYVTDTYHIKYTEPLALMVFNVAAEFNAVIVAVRGYHAAIIFNGTRSMHYIVCFNMNCHCYISTTTCTSVIINAHFHYY